MDELYELFLILNGKLAVCRGLGESLRKPAEFLINGLVSPFCISGSEATSAGRRW